MDRLSDELLYAILTHLDPWTLVRNIPLVSKRFRRVAFENRLWYAFSPSSHGETFSEKLQLDHWAQIDWQNEWKWRHAPLSIEWIDDDAMVLTFTLHQSDVIGLVDDGSLRRWRKYSSGWREISRTRSTAGRESFRLRRLSAGSEGQATLQGTTQLGYNDAITVSQNEVYFGAGKILQRWDVESETVSQLFNFGDETAIENSLITTVHQVGPSTLIFGSYPCGIHVVDLRQRNSLVQSGQVPKAPSAGQATPLCIRNRDTDNHDFLVCGRFPSILLYDLRNGLRVCNSIYSGANSLSSLAVFSTERIIAGGNYRGRGTLECINTRTLKLESKNRWTASNAAILAVAPRNSGIFAAGGSGKLRLLNGIHTGVRDIELNRMITKIEVGPSQSTYHNVAEQVYLGCGGDGVACVQFGIPNDDDPDDRFLRRIGSSLMAGQYADLHFFGSSRFNMRP